jgi:hypothetical protein
MTHNRMHTIKIDVTSSMSVGFHFYFNMDLKEDIMAQL